MTENEIDREVELTLASLDAVQPCRGSLRFAERVLGAVELEGATRDHAGLPGWSPRLAASLLLALLVLDSAAIFLSLQAGTVRDRRTLLWEVARFQQDGP